MLPTCPYIHYVDKAHTHTCVLLVHVGQSCPVQIWQLSPSSVFPLCVLTALLDTVPRVSIVHDAMIILIRQTVANLAGAVAQVTRRGATPRRSRRRLCSCRFTAGV